MLHRALSVSGGGGGGLSGATGTVSLNAASAISAEIDTGLKNLKSLLLVGTMTSFSNNTTHLYWADDYHNTQYQSEALESSNRYGGLASIGAYPSSGYGTYTTQLYSLDKANGKFQIRASSVNDKRYYTVSFTWYAVGE